MVIMCPSLSTNIYVCVFVDTNIYMHDPVDCIYINKYVCSCSFQRYLVKPSLCKLLSQVYL